MELIFLHPVPEIWSSFLRQGRSAESLRAAAEAVRQLIRGVELPSDLTGDDLLAELRERGLNPEDLKWPGGPQRSRLFEIFETVDHPGAGDTYALPSVPHRIQRRMILLAADWSLSGFSEGALSVIRSEDSKRGGGDPWVDLRTAIHLIWYWGVDEERGLVRALDAALALPSGDVHPFPPFVRLFAAVLDPFVDDPPRRDDLARSFAATAARGIRMIDTDATASVSLMRPVLQMAREVGLVEDRPNHDRERQEFLQAYARFATSVALDEAAADIPGDLVARLADLELVIRDE